MAMGTRRKPGGMWEKPMITDCEKCWDTPCLCGWEYRGWDKIARLELAAAVLGVPRDELRDMVGGLVPVDHPKKENAK